MPIYEYLCPACQRKFDLLRPFSRADELAACPVCQRTDTKRCLSTFAAHSRSTGGATTTVAGTGGGCGNCGGGGSCGGSCGSRSH
jgi:putative FmdB family regulatory protein